VWKKEQSGWREGAKQDRGAGGEVGEKTKDEKGTERKDHERKEVTNKRQLESHHRHEKGKSRHFGGAEGFR